MVLKQLDFDLHNLFYPLYAKLPDFIDKDHRHQYIVFAEDSKLKELHDLLKKLAITIEFDNKSFNLSFRNAKSDQSRIMLKNLGEITGSDWSEKNDHQCLLIAINRPTNLVDTKKLLISYFNGAINITEN